LAPRCHDSTVNPLVSAPLLMVASSFLFATMGVCVKMASAHYGTAEIVFYRGLVGAIAILALAHSQGTSLKTRVPVLHLRRGLSGVAALILWFQAIGQLPLATAITLNYMSSIWMAMLLIGSAWWLGRQATEAKLIWAVLAGFAGVALVLHPTFTPEQWPGALCGLISGLLAAVAYLQVTALGRSGEPELRVVFYFSLASAMGGLHSLARPEAGWLAATGLLATSAQILMTRAYAIGRTLSNASLQYLGIAWSFLYGVLIFAEPVTWMAVAGMIVIVVAGIIASRYSRPLMAESASPASGPAPESPPSRTPR